MDQQLVRVVRGEQGMTTAEYAVGVIAVIAAVGVLISVFMGGDFASAVNDLVLQVVHTISGVMGKVG